MHDNDDPLSNKNLSAKNTVDLIKLSIHLFQGGVKDNGLKKCKIERLDGTYARKKSSLFS
jgi:hypothetical protein